MYNLKWCVVGSCNCVLDLLVVKLPSMPWGQCLTLLMLKLFFKWMPLIVWIGGLHLETFLFSVHPLLEFWLILIEKTPNFTLMETIFFVQPREIHWQCLWYCASYPAIGQYWGLTDVVCRWCFSKRLLAESLLLMGLFDLFGTRYWLFSKCSQDMSYHNIFVGPRLFFRGTGVVSTDAGKCHLFRHWWVSEQLCSKQGVFVVGEIEKLSEIAITQPQAAYTAFTHVFHHHRSDSAHVPWAFLSTYWSPEHFCCDWTTSFWLHWTWITFIASLPW